MNLNTPIKQRLQTKAARAGIPIAGTFELTPRCNFQCKMCYVRMSEQEMREIGTERTAEEWLALGKAAFDAGMTFLLLTGGEPLLRPDFPQIYEGFARLGLSISLNTNGALLRGEIRELFLRYPPAQVNVTLYGTSSDTYRTLCGNASAFDHVVDTLHWLKKNGILVNLNATLTPWNLCEWRSIEDFARSEGLNYRPAIYTFPPVRRSSSAGVDRVPAEEIGAMIAQRELERHGVESAAAMLAAIDAFPPMQHCIVDGEPMRCFAGRSQFWITWTGTMTACGMLDVPQSEPFEKGFLPAWEEIRQAVSQIHLCADCKDCVNHGLCGSCAAVNYAETGRFDGKPEYMCRMTSAFLNTLRDAYK